MSQTIEMKYDKLSRMVQRKVPGTGGGTSNWVYDTATNGVGAIGSISGPNGYNKTFSYDAFSRPNGDTTTIKGDSFTKLHV